MVSSSPPSCPPSAAGAVYSKIGSSSSSSLQYSSAKSGYAGHGGNLQHNKLRAFCAGYGGRALACAVAALGICLLVVLLVQGRHSHNAPHKPGSSGSPFITPTPSPVPESPPPPPPTTTPSPSTPVQGQSLASLCNTTEQSQLCLTTLSEYPSEEPTAALQDLTAYVAGIALTYVNQTYILAVNLSRAGNGSGGEKAVLQDCMELLDQARDGLNDSMNRLTHLDANGDVRAQVMDVQVWMSSSYTEQDTCWDGFEDIEGGVKDQMIKAGQPIAPLIAMALSFAKTLKEVGFSSFYDLHSSSPP
eukprot:c5211_g1_i1 orf=191-1099(+)